MSKWVTIPMICEHVGRARSNVYRAIKACHVPVEIPDGTLQARVSLREANKMIAVRWPRVPPMGEKKLEEAQ